MSNFDVHCGDVLEWCASYSGEPFHAALLDPPYDLTSISKRFGGDKSAPPKFGTDGAFQRAAGGFMGAKWDSTGIAFKPETWVAIARHLYPGAYIFAFAGRNQHRQACAMEDAGLILHSQLLWVTGSSFPKATRIDTQIDKQKRRDYVLAAIELGLEIPGSNLHDWTKGEHSPGDKWWEKFKTVLSEEQWLEIERQVIAKGFRIRKESTVQIAGISEGEYEITAPSSNVARTWAGHRYGGQAIKNSVEHLIVAQKPYEGRPVDCITRTGAGALDIDGGRVGTNGGGGNGLGSHYDRLGNTKPMVKHGENREDTAGRWPSTLLLDADAATMLDRQSGVTTSGYMPAGTTRANLSGFTGNMPTQTAADTYGDSGGCSRFFFQSDWNREVQEALADADPMRYCPKAGSRERSEGLGMESSQMLRLREDLTAEERTYVMAELKRCEVEY